MIGKCEQIDKNCLLNGNPLWKNLWRTVGIAVVTGVLSACAPAQTDRVYNTPPTSFGPQQPEVDLGLDQLHATSITPTKLNWKGEVDTAALFRTSTALLDLGRIHKQPALSVVGQRLTSTYYLAKDAASRVEFTQSPYVLAAIGETRAESQRAVQENDNMLVRQGTLLANLLVKQGQSFPWPKGVSIDQELSSVERFVAQFTQTLERNGVLSNIAEGLRRALAREFTPLVRDGRAAIQSIFSEPNTRILIGRFQQFLAQHAVHINDQAMNQLNQVAGIGLAIENLNDADGALGVLIDLWKMATPEARQQAFQRASPELYGFFSTLSDSDFDCLRASFCANPIEIVLKNVKILPAIRQYGIPKLRDDLNLGLHTAITSEIERQAADLLPTVPSLINDRIAKEIGSIRGELAKVRSDYGTFVRGMAARFAQTQLGLGPRDTVPALEAARVKVDMTPGHFNFQPVRGMSGGEVIGASLGLATKRWTSAGAPKGQEWNREVISQLGKLLAIGGFLSENGKIYPSLSLTFDRAPVRKRLNLREVVSVKESFAVPQTLKVGAGFQVQDDTARQVSVAGQAELLRGMSSMIRFFRDWEKGVFDQTLGQVEVKDLITTLPADSIHEKFVPKDMIFALSVGNAASILQNMTKPLSMVFLLDIGNHAVWANDFNFDQSDNPATMAGIVGINAGTRLGEVNSRDLARYLLGILDFLDAIEGIEKSTSGPLVDGVKGQRPVDVLLESRARLRLLVVGLANFLSHELQGSDGGIAPRWEFSKEGGGHPILTGGRQLLDQAVAIRALHRAGTFLDLDIYRWAARDALTFLNRQMWDRETGFYRAIEGTSGGASGGASLHQIPNMEEVTEMLLAGEEVKPVLTAQGQTQWDLLAKPWLAALGQL